MKKLTLAAALAAAFGVAHADTAAPAAPSLGAVIAATPGLSVNGYVAASYTHFDTTAIAGRQFDVNGNDVQLNQASMTVSYLPSSGAGASVTLLGGSDASYLPGGSDFGVATAYAQYAVGPLTVMAGRLATLAGAEVVNPVADNQISRSLLFYYTEPIFHTGLRASYAVSDALTLTGGVNDGYNTTKTAAGASKTVELGASGALSKALSYSAAYYYTGTGAYYGGMLGKEQLFDLVVNYTATDALNFGANVDMVSKDVNVSSASYKANGIALYANYSLSDKVTLSGRGEYLDDKDGMLTSVSGANKVKEMTLAVNYTPVKGLKLSAEARQDKSDLAIYGSNDKQTSFELQAAYSF